MQEIQEKIQQVDPEAAQEWAGVENLLDDLEEKDAENDDKIASKDIKPVKNINTMGAKQNFELQKDVEETKTLNQPKQ